MKDNVGQHLRKLYTVSFYDDANVNRNDKIERSLVIRITPTSIVYCRVEVYISIVTVVAASGYKM